MKEFQHGQLFTNRDTLLIQNLLREALTDIQSSDSSEGWVYSESGVRAGRTLHEAIERSKEQFERRARALNKKSCTKNDRVHWQIRGRQELLRCVADHVQKLRKKYGTSYTLYLALKDYLGCLEKYEVDVEEEKRASHSTSGRPVQKWKAEGAAQELPGVFARLARLLAEYAPLIERHTLSFDGTTLEPRLL